MARDLRDRLSEHPPAAGRRGRGSAHNRSRPASLGTRHRGDCRAPSPRVVVRREHLPPRRPLCHGLFPPRHRECPQNCLGLGGFLGRLGPGRTALRGPGRHSPRGPGTGAQAASIRWIRTHLPGGAFAALGRRRFRAGQGRIPAPTPDRNTEWFDRPFSSMEPSYGSSISPAPGWWWSPGCYRLRLPSFWRAGSWDVSAREVSNLWFSFR